MADALRQPPALVLVEGEAGIGKSRLVREALAAVGIGGSRSLVAVCPPFRQGLTLGPIVDAARQAVRSSDHVRELGLSALAGTLRPLFPEWADALPAAPEPLADDGAARHRLIRAFAELLECMGVGILVVEDVHWADEATVEFLLFLASRRPLPLSLVATYRPQEVTAESLLLRLSSRPPAGPGISHAHVTLGGLAAADTAALVVSMLGDGNVRDIFTSFMHECTGGVPLVLEECLRLLLDRADLVHRDGEWVQRAPGEIAVPPTVRDAVTERVARLGTGAQRVLLAAAVLAEPADERTVGVVSGLPGGECPAAHPVVESAVAEAVRSGLLVEDDAGRVAFRHSLAARAVYDQAPAPERRAAHRRAAVALEKARPRPVGRLARHFRQAGEIARWREYAEQAADVALASGDYRSALTLLHELITEPQLVAQAVAPLVQKMPFLAVVGYPRRADIIAALRGVLEMDRLSARDRVQVRGQLGRVLIHLGDFAAAAAELELVASASGEETFAPGEGTFADAWAMTVLACPWTGPWPPATHLRWHERSLRLAESLPLAPHQRMSLRVTAMSALLELGEESGWVLAEEIGEDEPTPQIALERARSGVNAGDAAMRWGFYGAARSRLTSAIDIASRHGYQVIRHMAQVTLLHVDYFTGTWEGLAERARECAGAVGEPACRVEALLVTARLGLGTADGDREAGDLLRTVREESQRRGMIALWLESSAALAQLRLADGDAGDALALTDDGMRLVLDKGIWVWATEIAPVRMAALTATGQVAEAERAVDALGAGLRGRRMAAPQAALEECRAVLAEGRGDLDAAVRAWDTAARAWARLPRPYSAARARQNVDRCLRAAGGTRRGGRRGYGVLLSPSEREVVRLMLDGMTNRQIARELSKSPHTVAAQLKSAMRKYGVTTRTALAVSVMQAESA